MNRSFFIVAAVLFVHAIKSSELEPIKRSICMNTKARITYTVKSAKKDKNVAHIFENNFDDLQNMIQGTKRKKQFMKPKDRIVLVDLIESLDSVGPFVYQSFIPLWIARRGKEGRAMKIVLAGQHYDYICEQTVNGCAIRWQDCLKRKNAKTAHNQSYRAG